MASQSARLIAAPIRSQAGCAVGPLCAHFIANFWETINRDPRLGGERRCGRRGSAGSRKPASNWGSAAPRPSVASPAVVGELALSDPAG